MNVKNLKCILKTFYNSKFTKKTLTFHSRKSENESFWLMLFPVKHFFYCNKKESKFYLYNDKKFKFSSYPEKLRYVTLQASVHRFASPHPASR